jgi:hypothetical protein
MRKKKMLDVMLPLTIGIWVVVIARIYSAFHSQPKIFDNVINTANYDTSKENINDTFSIINNYRDPFEIGMSKQSSIKIVNPDSRIPHTIKDAPAKKETIWPVIQYSGMIKNQKSNKQLAMVLINGNLKNLKSGEVCENVTICKIFKDSIEIMFEKQKRFYKK